MDKNDIARLLQKPKTYARDELDTLRAGFAESHCIQDNQTYVMSRLNLELIDRIIHLDDTSTELINTTNKLTSRILWLTVVGVALALVGLVLSFVEVLHR